jgi:hypothetical protein
MRSTPATCEPKVPGDDLEALLLVRVGVKRADLPTGLADPIELEQFAVPLFSGLPKYNPFPVLGSTISSPALAMMLLRCLVSWRLPLSTTNRIPPAEPRSQLPKTHLLVRS